ncbi:MAG: bifunctional chorismate mutase/prephenate dehydratase [Christensenellales bacterium]|jgi:chorismate mutase/prephenate dehydratase
MGIERYRREIDKIDRDMLDLFLRRMQAAKEIGVYKKEKGLPVYDARREADVLDSRVGSVGEEHLRQSARDFFVSLMELSKAYQKRIVLQDALPLRREAEGVVAFQGVEGAFSEEALFSYFAPDVQTLAQGSFEDVLRAVGEGRAQYGVLPAENSATGVIAEVYDLLTAGDCVIVGERMLRVRHCLLALPGVEMGEIRTVCSHPQGLLQCQDFIRKHGFLQRSMENTALSAQQVAQMGDRSLGAIASCRAAQVYGLEVLRSDISRSGNTTRFIVIGATQTADSRADKVSVAFTLRHESGALYRALSCFYEEGLNLLKIESRHGEGNWEYRFYVDFEGNLDEERVQRAFAGIQRTCTRFKLLGNYRMDPNV